MRRPRRPWISAWRRGASVATGPLDGPGRRTVRRLEWRRPSGDLSVLERFEDLEDLGLLDIGQCAIPEPLRLPAGLRDLTVVNDAPGAC